MGDAPLNALFWGTLSAASLPAGAILGLLWRPGSKVVSGLMAFGAGALLFGLSIELLGDVPEIVDRLGNVILAATILGALAGGALFDVANQLLNNRGAFLRNISNARHYAAIHKLRRARRLLKAVSRIPVFEPLTAVQIAELVRHVKRQTFQADAVLFSPGESAEFLYYIRSGEIVLVDRDGKETRLSNGDIFGERAVVLEATRDTRAVAARNTVVYALPDDEVRTMMQRDLGRARLMRRLARASQPDRQDGRPEKRYEEAQFELEEGLMPVDPDDLREEEASVGFSATAAVAIWLGIGIDAIPESFVIGTMAVGTNGVSLAFVAGVFLANFPEALTSAVAMRAHGFGLLRIVVMWSSICALTGAGAFLAPLLLLGGAQETELILIMAKAVAAGAMLTAITESMLPEAFQQGGAIVGMATLMGFLTALSIAAL